MKVFFKILFATFLTLKGTQSMAIEEPHFSVIKKIENEVEIRNYESYFIAETLVDDSFDEAGNKGFKILADYIFGNNKGQSKIAMTAPVTQKQESSKIAMTAPVAQVASQNGYLIQFTMPAIYTRETLPEPNDGRVTIREVPSHKVAVYTYSGSWSQSKFDEKLKLFKEILSRENLKYRGEARFARYNSPFALWFLRRNEIWLELEPSL